MNYSDLCVIFKQLVTMFTFTPMLFNYNIYSS